MYYSATGDVVKFFILTTMIICIILCLYLSEVKAIRKRNIPIVTDIATEEKTESISHEKIQQENAFSNLSLRLITAGIFSIILMSLIMYWYRRSTGRPTAKHDKSLYDIVTFATVILTLAIIVIASFLVMNSYYSSLKRIIRPLIIKYKLLVSKLSNYMTKSSKFKLKAANLRTRIRKSKL